MSVEENTLIFLYTEIHRKEHGRKNICKFAYNWSDLITCLNEIHWTSLPDCQDGSFLFLMEYIVISVV